MAIVDRVVSQDGYLSNGGGSPVGGTWDEDGFSSGGEQIDFIDFKADGRKHVYAMRFDISDIPAGVTITSATVTWTWTNFLSSTGVSVDVEYRAKDAADCGTLTQGNDGWSWRDVGNGGTTAAPSETLPAPNSITSQTTFTTTDISAVIQELVDSYGGSLGDLGLNAFPIGSAPGSDEFWGIHDLSSSGAAATISVDWATPGIDSELASSSTLTSDLTVTKKLDSSLNGSSALTGDITITKSVQTSLINSSTLTSDLTITKHIASSLGSTSLLTPALLVTKKLVSNLNGLSALGGDLRVTKTVQATIAASSVLTGELTTPKSLLSMLSSSSSVSTNLTVPKRLSASFSIQSVLSSDLTTGIQFTANLSSNSTLTGILQVVILNPEDITDAIGVSTTMGIDIGVTSTLSDSIGVTSTL